MRYLRLLGLTVLTVWLGVSFLGAWRPLGVVPDLFLVVLVVAASSKIHASELMSMAIGGGFLLDYVSGIDFGLRIAFFCFIALLMVIIRRTGADFERLSTKLVAVLGFTVLYDAVILVPLLWLKNSISLSTVLNRVGMQLVLNAVLLGLLYWPLRRLFDIGAGTAPVINQRHP